MRSIVDALGTLINNEELIMRGDFFALPAEETDNLAKDFFDAFYPMLKDICVMRLSFGDRSLRSLEEALKNSKSIDGSYYYNAEIYLKGERMKKKSDIRAYEREVFFNKRYHENDTISGPADYCSYYAEHILPLVEGKEMWPHEKERLKPEIQKLMDLEGRIHFREPLYRDFGARFSCTHMKAGTNLYYGYFYLTARAYCLEGDTDTWCGIFDGIARNLMKRNRNTNIYIAMDSLPIEASNYSLYFSRNIVQDVYYACQAKGISGSYYHYAAQAMKKVYLDSVSWGHYICPRTKSLSSLSTESKSFDRVFMEELEGGGLFVRSASPISQTDISELKAVKRVIYPLVLPCETLENGGGACSRSIHENMRSRWEKVPVFEDEIVMLNTGYTYVHHGTINLNRLMELVDIEPVF